MLLLDKTVALIIMCLAFPVILLLAIWTGVHPYKYDESRILYNCPNIVSYLVCIILLV